LVLLGLSLGKFEEKVRTQLNLELAGEKEVSLDPGQEFAVGGLDG
jgi:hypothetical protein